MSASVGAEAQVRGRGEREISKTRRARSEREKGHRACKERSLAFSLSKMAGYGWVPCSKKPKVIYLTF